MTSQEIIRRLQSIRPFMRGHNPDTIQAAIDYIDRYRWHSVDEELPDKDNNYLTIEKLSYGDKPFRSMRQWFGHRWDATPYTTVTHWAHIPPLEEE